MDDLIFSLMDMRVNGEEIVVIMCVMCYVIGFRDISFYEFVLFFCEVFR